MKRKKKVLITGTSGLVGGVVWNRMAEFPEKYDLYALDRTAEFSDRTTESMYPKIPEDHFFQVDLADYEAVKRAMEGMDAVVHLAADPRPDAPWEELRDSNITGTYYIFEAARECGVKRVVIASSIMAVWAFRGMKPYSLLKEGRFGKVPQPFPHLKGDAVGADTVYGSTKVWGEALARTYSEMHGISGLCVRIGHVAAVNEPTVNNKDVFCSFRDIGQMFQRCVDAPEKLKFDIFYGISKSKYCWADVEHARKTVGYEPQDTVDL